MFKPTKLYLIAAICFQIITASDYNTLYLMEFENTSSIKEIDYLRHSLPDIIKSTILDLNTNLQIEYAGSVEPYLGIKNNKNINSVILLGKYIANGSILSIILETYEVETWNKLSSDSYTCNMNDGNCFGRKMTDYSNLLLTYLLTLDGYSKNVKSSVSENNEISISDSPLDELNRVIGNFSVEVELNHSLDKMNVDGNQYGNRYYKDINKKSKNNFLKDTKQTNTDKLLGYIDDILLNPYDVAIHDISFDYSMYNNDYVDIKVPVSYTVKKSLIEDLLSTLPQSSKSTKHGKLLIKFSNKDFSFTNIIKDRFSLSKYQVLPVLFLSNEIGKINYVYLDSWENRGLGRNSNVEVFQSNEFYPLLAITPGEENLLVNLDIETLTINYHIKLSLKHIEDYSKVAIKFLYENQINNILNQFYNKESE